MLPHHELHTHLWTLAHTSNFLIACPETPKVLRRELIKLLRRIKKKLPDKALLEVLAVEAEAVIKASDALRKDHFRRPVSDS